MTFSRFARFARTLPGVLSLGPSILIVVLALPALHCSGVSDPALGSYESIRVIYQSTPPPDLMSSVEDALAIPFVTFQEETLFYLYPHPVRQLEDFQNLKNLLFLVDLSERGQLTDIANELLGAAKLNEVVRGGTSTLLFLDNVWARGQTAAFLLAADHAELQTGLQTEGDRIRSGFLNSNRKRILKYLLYRGENKTLSRQIFEDHGWFIRMPAPFVEDPRHTGEGFFTMKMGRPGRLLFVYWMDGFNSLPEGDEIIALRNDLGFRYYDEDEIEPTLTGYSKALFKGWDAIRLEGVWQNDKYVIGGPFRSVAFLQPQTDRLFLIDYCVYAPDFPKKYYLWELESVLETFTFEGPPEESS